MQTKSFLTALSFETKVALDRNSARRSIRPVFVGVTAIAVLVLCLSAVYTRASASTYSTTPLCGDGSAPDYGFTYDRLSLVQGFDTVARGKYDPLITPTPTPGAITGPQGGLSEGSLLCLGIILLLFLVWWLPQVTRTGGFFIPPSSGDWGGRSDGWGRGSSSGWSGGGSATREGSGSGRSGRGN